MNWAHVVLFLLAVASAQGNDQGQPNENHDSQLNNLPPELMEARSMIAKYLEVDPSQVWNVYEAIMGDISAAFESSEEESDSDMSESEEDAQDDEVSNFVNSIPTNQPNLDDLRSIPIDQLTLDHMKSDSFFQCDKVFSEPRPFHNESTWLYLRGVYEATVGPYYSTISANIYSDGFHVPVYVDYIEGKGRGIFAKEDIANGTTIWKSYQTARFSAGHDYRNFLMTLPDDLACDVMKWAYVEESDNDELRIAVDLDRGSFINTANSTEELNTVERSGLGLIACRDIPAGEEVVVNYTQFFIENAWSYFGL